MLSRKQLMQVITIQTEIAKLGLELGEVMQYIVEQTLSLVGADGAVIEMAEGDEMVYRAASGIAESQLGLRLAIETSLTGLCVRTGQSLTCIDSETDSRVDRLACRKMGLRAMIVIPLKHNDATVGALKAMSKEPGRFQDQEMTLLEMLSDVVAASMFLSTKYDSDHLFFNATHDNMTGLANRALFMDRLRRTLARSGRDKQTSGLLMIDMDGLKQINDTHGHRIGDAVLVEFGRRLKSALRDTDTVARIGGDEFAVILTPIDNSRGMKSVLDRIDSEIAKPFEYENSKYLLKGSIGSVVLPREGSDLERLLDLADQRMYAVKRDKSVNT